MLFGVPVAVTRNLSKKNFTLNRSLKAVVQLKNTKGVVNAYVNDIIAAKTRVSKVTVV